MPFVAVTSFQTQRMESCLCATIPQGAPPALAPHYGLRQPVPAGLLWAVMMCQLYLCDKALIHLVTGLGSCPSSSQLSFLEIRGIPRVSSISELGLHLAKDLTAWRGPRRGGTRPEEEWRVAKTMALGPRSEALQV